MSAHDFARLECRLAQLERQNSQFKRGVSLLLVLVSSFFLIAAYRAGDNVLEANGLVLKDRRGQMRVRLQCTEQNGVLQQFFDDQGAERVRIQVDKGGAARIWLQDDEETPRVAAYAFPIRHQDSPSRSGISVLGGRKNAHPEPKESITLQTSLTQEAKQVICDRNGNERIVLSASADQNASLAILSKDGNYEGALQLGTTPAGQAYEEFLGQKGQRRQLLSLEAYGATSHQFLDSDGHVRMESTLQHAGDVITSWNANDGKARIAAISSKEGKASVNLLDHAQKSRIRLLTQGGLSMIGLSDADERPRIMSFTTANHEAGQLLLGRDGKPSAPKNWAKAPVSDSERRERSGESLEIQILELQREIEHQQSTLTKATEEVRKWDRVIDQGGQAVQKTRSFGEQLLQGAASGAAIGLRADAERRRQEAESTLNFQRDRLLRLQKQRIQNR